MFKGIREIIWETCWTLKVVMLSPSLCGKYETVDIFQRRSLITQLFFEISLNTNILALLGT